MESCMCVSGPVHVLWPPLLSPDTIRVAQDTSAYCALVCWIYRIYFFPDYLFWELGRGKSSHLLADCPGAHNGCPRWAWRWEPGASLSLPGGRPLPFSGSVSRKLEQQPELRIEPAAPMEHGCLTTGFMPHTDPLTPATLCQCKVSYFFSKAHIKHFFHKWCLPVLLICFVPASLIGKSKNWRMKLKRSGLVWKRKISQ